MKLGFIRPCQGCPAERLTPEMIELAALSRNVIRDIPQTMTTGQFFCQSLKFMSLENSYNLRKNSDTMRRGLELLLMWF